MSKEIGGEFWLTEVPSKYTDSSPEWVNDWGNHILTSSGRGAILLMLKHVKDRVTSKIALLPAYICESVIMPFIREGYNCYFYDINYDLKPNIESIKCNLKMKIGIFLHMGYFGFSTNDNLYTIISDLKSSGTIIVEDVTHTLFSKFERYPENDYYVASLRKWAGLPSGGFLASKYDDINYCFNRQSNFISIRKEALLLKRQYVESNSSKLKDKFLHMFHEAEEILNQDLGPYVIDEVSNTIINKLDTEILITRRRGNFIYLHDALRNIKDIELIFKNISNATCPIFFPVYVHAGRNKLKELLISEDIYCPIHWPIPPQVNINSYPLSKDIYRMILSIPCDQRYNIKDMQRIRDVIYQYYLT